MVRRPRPIGARRELGIHSAWGPAPQEAISPSSRGPLLPSTNCKQWVPLSFYISAAPPTLPLPIGDCPQHLSSLLSLQQFPQGLLCFKDFKATPDRETSSRAWWGGVVTRITTVGKPQRVKRVEFQLPLAFIEMEMELGQPFSEAFPRLLFFHGPMDIASFFSSFMPGLGAPIFPSKASSRSAPTPIPPRHQ